MKDKRKVLKIVVCILFLFLIFMNVNQNIFAAVNTGYGQNTAVNEPDLDKKVKDNMLLNVLGEFIYGVASMIEYLVGKVFEALTGNNMFPWADKVIFNTVPLLDINFLNPDSSSLFGPSGNPTTIAKVVKSTYFTVLSLAIAFLGIVVGIMAIKLAVSAIASEKAKYKEAISNWLLAIVLLFTMHYALSFMFFANEKMVEVASGILTSNIKDKDIADKLAALSNVEDDKQIVTNYIKVQYDVKFSDWVATNFITNLSNLTSQLIPDDRKKELTDNEQYTHVAAYLLNNSTYTHDRILYAEGNTNRNFWQQAANFLAKTTIPLYGIGQKGVTWLYEDVKYIVDVDPKTKDEVAKDCFTTLYPDDAALANVMFQDWKTFVKAGSTGKTTSASNIISSMGEYFKKAAWTIPTNSKGEKTGWSATNVSLQGAILYAIFIVQSMMFFFAYMKRFFYVIILAMLAPLVVIYDFFTKSIV